MRFIVSALALALGGPAGAALLAHGLAGIGHLTVALSAALPDPATAGAMAGGLGLVAGARRRRRLTVSD